MTSAKRADGPREREQLLQPRLRGSLEQSLDRELDRALDTLRDTDGDEVPPAPFRLASGAERDARPSGEERAAAVLDRLRIRRAQRRRRTAFALAAILAIGLALGLLHSASADRQHERELQAAAVQLERLQAEIRLLRHQIDAAQRRADAVRPALYLTGDERAEFYLDLAALARSRAVRTATDSPTLDRLDPSASDSMLLSRPQAAGDL